MKQNIELIVEKDSDGYFFGRSKIKDFLATGQGKNMEQLITNVKESIEDYKEHEGKGKKFWDELDPGKLKFDIAYDIEAFFDQFDELNISAIASRARINQSLLRQYKTGAKNASLEQVKKIEQVIHELGKELLKVALV